MIYYEENIMRKVKYNVCKFVLELIKPLAYICIRGIYEYEY